MQYTFMPNIEQREHKDNTQPLQASPNQKFEI